MGSAWRDPSAGAGDVPDAVREAFRARRRGLQRDTALIGGAVAVLAVPAWAVFDAVLLPERAGEILVVRVLCAAAIAVVWAVLRWTAAGHRSPAALSFLLAALTELAIAWMVPRAGDQVEAYILGLTLAIYATALLLEWRWTMTVALVATTAAGTAASSVGASPGLDAAQVTTMAFYLATVTALAVAAQVYRDRRAWQQHLTQAALAAEQVRNGLLVEELERLSREDPLTALANRRAWDEHLVGEHLRACRSGQPLSVMVVDLDRFKDVNDADGHATGDAVLRATAGLLAEAAGPSDFVARLGGDEFGILCPGTRLDEAAARARRLCATLGATALPGGRATTCSIGVAELRPEESVDSLSRRADTALYEAKATRGTVRCAVALEGAAAPASG